MLKNLKLSPAIIIGLLVLAGIVFFLSRCGGNQQVPVTGNGDLGRMFVASQVTEGDCPAGSAESFTSFDPIYVGFEESNIPQGTGVFARLIRDGQPVEDTREITADRDLRSTCVWFVFEPSGGSEGFEPGNYEAVMFVNGNEADRLEFEITGRGSAPAGGSSGVQLGRLYATTGVDDNGCPTDNAGHFFSDEQIYVSFEESQIPARTEMFARLLREGRPVEDTDPIRADRDIRSCVWFVFEPTGSGGLEPGNYEVQIFVNGDQADAVEFEVR